MAIIYESYYGITSLGNDYIEHHGIKGQKWGVRRFQNPDGSLTGEGKKRYSTDGGRKFQLSDKQKTVLKRAAITAGVAAAAYGAYKVGSKASPAIGDIKGGVKQIKKMSDDDIIARVGRLEKEKRLIDLEREISNVGKSRSRLILEKAGSATVASLTTAGAVYAGKKALEKTLDAYGIDGSKTLREMYPKKK